MHRRRPAARRRRERYGPVTFWLMEDFTLGSVPGLGPRWFYDSNAPDVAIGPTLTLEH